MAPSGILCVVWGDTKDWLFRARVTFNLASRRAKMVVLQLWIFSLILWLGAVVSLADGGYGGAVVLVILAGLLTWIAVRYWRRMYRERYPD
jgi:hypothetical protein